MYYIQEGKLSTVVKHVWYVEPSEAIIESKWRPKSLISQNGPTPMNVLADLTRSGENLKCSPG